MRVGLSSFILCNMKIQIPKPDRWQDFEDLCCDLWKSIWGDPNAHLHGRRGQKQNGVDILGRPAFSQNYHAVQCKGKDDNTMSTLEEAEIVKESSDAELIRPPIEEFVIATTANRDTKLQEYCRLLTISDKPPFGVNIWFWDDIATEIQCRPDLLERHYRNFDFIKPSNEFVIDRYSSQDKIAAFLSRPIIKDNISRDLLELLYPLIYELVDNSFGHGKAGNCKISFSNNKLVLRDNGNPFDIHQLIGKEGRGGAREINFVLSELGKDIDVEYEYNEKRENVTSFIFASDVMRRPLNESVEITLDYASFIGRQIGESLAKADYSSVPSYKKNIIINVVVPYGIGPSFCDSYFNSFCQYLREGQRATVYLPNSAGYLFGMLYPLEEKYPIKFIVRK